MNNLGEDPTGGSELRPSLTAAPVLARYGAGFVGVLGLLVSMVMTIGVVLTGLLGIGAAQWIQRRRARTVTPLGAWLGASMGSTVTITAFMVLLVLSLPDGSYEEAMAAIEAAQESRPPPQWAERLSNPYGPPAPGIERVLDSRGAGIYFGIVGGALGMLIVGSFVGSLAWAAAMLIGYAYRGRWPFQWEGGPAVPPT